MKPVPPGADKPWSHFVGMIVFVSRLIEGERSDQFAGLIDRIELLAEAVEVFPLLRGCSDCRCDRVRRSPIYDLITNHTFVDKGKARGNLTRPQRLRQFQSTSELFRCYDASDNQGAGRNLNG